MHQDVITESGFAHFKANAVRRFTQEIELHGAAMLATKEQWLSVVPAFADFHELLPTLISLELRRVADERPSIVRSLLRTFSNDAEVAMAMYGVWVSCSYHVHDEVVRNDRPPSAIEKTAWALEYGQQLSLMFRRMYPIPLHRSKHHGAKAPRIPTRKMKKRK